MPVHLKLSRLASYQTTLAFQRGVTLIELLIAIVIISVGLAGVLSIINYTVGHSADPIIQQQAIAIAESYLEEILLQAYTDPDGATETTRATFDNVRDYNGLSDSGAHDQQGNLVSNLSEYHVSVGVTGPISIDQTVNGVAQSALGLQVTVTVSVVGMPDIALLGYKFDY